MFLHYITKFRRVHSKGSQKQKKKKRAKEIQENTVFEIRKKSAIVRDILCKNLLYFVIINISFALEVIKL